MRFQRLGDDATLELRHPRGFFFLFGPFYLAWQRLWVDAVVMTGAVWAVVHGTAVMVRDLTGARSFDVLRAYAALDVIRAATVRTPASDRAFRELVAMTLPIYAAAFALLCLMLLLSALIPRYLKWRFASRGWQVVQDESRATARVAGSDSPRSGQ